MSRAELVRFGRTSLGRYMDVVRVDRLFRRLDSDRNGYLSKSGTFMGLVHTGEVQRGLVRTGRVQGSG